MKRLFMLLTLGATMALMLALAGSASAAKPEVRTFHFEGTDVIADCGDFEVVDDFVFDIRSLAFFDRAGNEDFARNHFVIHDIFSNSVTGESFATTTRQNVVVDLPSLKEISGSGLSYRVTVPGEGVVLLQAGRLEFDEAGNVAFQAGPKQVLEQDFAKLCAALAGS